MTEICVAHLVRKRNGLSAFDRFIRSYKDHAPGIDHDLLLIFKGFDGDHDLPDYLARIHGLSHISFPVPDRGFDIEPYFAAARRFDYQYFCFLNSYSTILDRDWLAKLHNHITQPAVGIVGATGSYESALSNQLLLIDALPFANWPAIRAAAGFYLKRRELMFPPFPNYHLRTNAFLISRSVLLKLKVDPIRTKRDVISFESGQRSLTRQILDMGLKPLVIGRDGRAYEKDQWYDSCTYRNDEQANLLVADNRTDHYLSADPDTRRILSLLAWGYRAGAGGRLHASRRGLLLKFAWQHMRTTLRRQLRDHGINVKY